MHIHQYHNTTLPSRRKTESEHPPSTPQSAPPVRASVPAPIPNSKNTSTSSPHTVRDSTSTPPVCVPTTSAALRSRPILNAPHAQPSRAENQSPPRAQK